LHDGVAVVVPINDELGLSAEWFLDPAINSYYKEDGHARWILYKNIIIIAHNE